MKLRLLAALAAALAAAASASAASAPPEVQARAYLVQNATTGEVLAAQDEAVPVPIASITKLMTVLVALERADLDDVVVVTPQAAAVGESTIELEPGERIAVRDLVAACLVQSANDAAHALAFHVGGGSRERFVELMNAKARSLGLRETRFVRPDGLDVAGHVSSARDVTKLARVAMRQPLVRELVARRTMVAAGRRLDTWNDLLGTFPRLIGVKTGHTAQAGWSQVAAARGRGVTIYATLLGGPTRAERNEDLAELLAWGLSRFRVVPAVSPERTYATARTEFGRPSVPLVAPRELVRVVHVERPLLERVVAPDRVELPVREGQELGRVEVYDGETLVAESPLLAARSVERPGRRARFEWYAGRALENALAVVS